mmetsp:Transcript_78642/g.217418  ORF Transcript_78642/g.217418 Transcript_78642/m.217418 type:complete len:201 (+) Transcript_78642:52-654(+)
MAKAAHIRDKGPSAVQALKCYSYESYKHGYARMPGYVHPLFRSLVFSSSSSAMRLLWFLASSSSCAIRFSTRCIGITKRKKRECAPWRYLMESSALIQRSKRQKRQLSSKSLCVLKKLAISSLMCFGTSSMSCHSFIRGSLLGTPMSFTSGPISSMHSAAPTTRTSATDGFRKGTVERIITSTGLPSSATVCGMKPALPG